MNVKLTDEENRMLDGSQGKLKQKAMELTVRYADVLGAEELCRVTKAHLFCGAHSFLNAMKSDDLASVLSEMWFCSSEKLPLDKMACYCQSCVGPLDPQNWREMGATEAEFEKNQAVLARCLDAGVNLIGTCAPYLVGFIPLMGEHYVTSESSAVIFLNAAWGACGNADGIEAGFCAAVCGRTPLWGNHLMANRQGTHVFDIQCRTETDLDWGLLGYAVGRKLPLFSVPVLSGKFTRPEMISFKNFCAPLAVTSGAEMCHIVGVTPEARTLSEALGGGKPQDVITITDRDLDEALSLVSSSGSGPVGFVSLGCPHYSIEEIRRAANFLAGKKIAPGVTLHIWTPYSIKTIADQCGYSQTIRQAGGHLMTSTCPTVHCRNLPGIASWAFDSAKQAHSLRDGLKKKGISATIYVGTAEDCLQAAVSGRWEGR